jgi:hypothetical protein
LRAVFPDATLVLTHRDPVDVLQSAATMIAYGDRLRRDVVDPPATAAYWADRIERMLQACVAERDAWPAECSLDLRFEDVVRDELAAVQSVHALAGVPMKDTLTQAVTAHLADRAAAPRTAMRYDLRRDFGLEPAAVRERCAGYIRRFLAQ